MVYKWNNLISLFIALESMALIREEYTFAIAIAN